MSNEHDVWGPGPESAESVKAWETCDKNPGHKNFIPLDVFGINYMPDEWKRENLVLWIKAQASLTVRLRVFRTSPDRTDDGHDYGGEDNGPRIGTGFVYFVEPTDGPCPCAKCEGQGEMAWKLYTKSAKHVVFDDFEVKRTKMDFFFDDEQSKKDGRMKTITGEKLDYTIADVDFCVFISFCHDGDLAGRLMTTLTERDVLWNSFKDWYMSLMPRPLIIVSHPHGMPKRVTVGELRDAVHNESHTRLITYSTSTCPGSSGAGGLGIWWWSTEVKGFGLTHCQGCGEEGYNKGVYNVL